ITSLKENKTWLFKTQTWTLIDGIIDCIHSEENLVVIKNENRIIISRFRSGSNEFLWSTSYDHDYIISKIVYGRGILWMLSEDTLYKMKFNDNIRGTDGKLFLMVDSYHDLTNTCLDLFPGVDRLWLLTKI